MPVLKQVVQAANGCLTRYHRPFNNGARPFLPRTAVLARSFSGLSRTSRDVRPESAKVGQGGHWSGTVTQSRSC